MKRRTFLSAPVLGCFSLLPFISSVDIKNNLTSEGALVFDIFPSFFSDPMSAASVGKEYLDSHPELLDSEQLLSNMGISGSSSNQAKVSLFENRRSEDYLVSNTVNIDGWILSMAEVSLCCAVAISLTNS